MSDSKNSNEKKSGCLKSVMVGFGVFVALILVVAIFGKSDEQPSTAIAGGDALDNSTQISATLDDPENNLTGPQKNAVRSAKQYLAISGFSREGLIEQLSSDAGNGYRLSDATLAVDSLDVDWKAQAVRSAKQYLSISGFSCKGLIEQLSSSAGSKYTIEEATYGANQAGAC